MQVTIEGDGGLVISGAGPQEVRLKTGSYRVQATEGGQVVKQELVTIERGGRQVVRVALEPSMTTPEKAGSRKDAYSLGSKACSQNASTSRRLIQSNPVDAILLEQRGALCSSEPLRRGGSRLRCGPGERELR